MREKKIVNDFTIIVSNDTSKEELENFKNAYPGAIIKKDKEGKYKKPTYEVIEIDDNVSEEDFETYFNALLMQENPEIPRVKNNLKLTSTEENSEKYKMLKLNFLKEQHTVNTKNNFRYDDIYNKVKSGYFIKVQKDFKFILSDELNFSNERILSNLKSYTYAKEELEEISIKKFGETLLDFQNKDFSNFDSKTPLLM